MTKTKPCEFCKGTGIEYVKGLNDETELATCRKCRGRGENVDPFIIRVSQRAIDETDEYFFGKKRE